MSARAAVERALWDALVLAAELQDQLARLAPGEIPGWLPGLHVGARGAWRLGSGAVRHRLILIGREKGFTSPALDRATERQAALRSTNAGHAPAEREP